MVVALIGNLSEGFKAVGPFKDFDEATVFCTGRESWIMTVEDPVEHARAENPASEDSYWHDAIMKFQSFEIIDVDGDWELTWVFLGEGNNGDFVCDDLNDAPLLRADLSYKGKSCRDGSYCTRAPVDTSRERLEAFARNLFELLKTSEGGGDPKDEGEEVGFSDRIMQGWTWDTNPEDLA